MDQIRSRLNVDGKKSRTRLLDLNVNGETHEVTAKPRVMLLEVIRDQVGLTGTKDGCESGTCGACTVLVDDKPTLACITLAVECDGKEIRTVEGLADGEKLNDLQEAFLDQGATQCGFCTPGVLMSATALLEKTAKPNKQQINKALEGNLCRCTGYNSIVDAVLQVSEQGVKAKMQ
jgi:carbon-monoxide dehydrogenase small subunit|tara:strand:- start:360 stop:887 length:528 start_codon:yes stop_codon:yes gene_type:complete